MPKALIDLPSSLVVQVENNEFPVDKDHIWVTCTPDITAGNYTYQDGKFIPIPIPVPPEPTAEENKIRAINLLTSSDWVALNDVNLVNKSDWFAYRSSLRSIATNPKSGNIQWPNKPNEIWS